MSGKQAPGIDNEVLELLVRPLKSVFADADEAVNLSSIAGMWAWNNNQAHKVTINYDGSVQSSTGPGRAEAADPIKRSFIIIVAAGFG